MNALNISNNIAYSAEGFIVLSKSVILTLNAIKRNGRSAASVEDVTFAINSNYKRGTVTEKQVKAVMVRIASEISKGYSYTNLAAKLVNLGSDFYSL